MDTAAAARAFVERWGRNTLNERAVAQSHFIDLCDLLKHPTPNRHASNAGYFEFEKPLTKVGGSAGFADVWKKDCFAWEYKTKGKYRDLSGAYTQLLLYKEALDNPPILVACDIEHYEVHIAFTGHKTRIETFTNDDLATISTRELLHLVFNDPAQLRPAEKITTITETIAAEFSKVAQLVERRGYEPHRVAHFFMKLLFGMFAEDIQLLKGQVLSKCLSESIKDHTEFPDRIRTLFRSMRDGGYFGDIKVPHINGGLFNDDDVIPLDSYDLMFLDQVAKRDWKEVEPAIFGTLFERSLDPSKRAKLGAHYTARQDIELLVRPVLMEPLRREWAATQHKIERLRPAWEMTAGIAHHKIQHEMEGYLLTFMEQLSTTTVLDAACGSGNFLYVALHELKDLEKEVLQYATGIGLPKPARGVGPHQLYGIEVSPFAAELAQVVVWIGELQWERKNGFWDVPDPVLQDLNNIQCADALMTIHDDGSISETPWPETTVILGNPPFLGGNKIRKGLGDTYVDTLFSFYAGRVPAFADLVCYWFERARAHIEQGYTQRGGLLATQGIRGGANRQVLERIKTTGNIFWAYSDRDWILDGATVHVSLVGFDNGAECQRSLNGISVSEINADLTTNIDLTQAPQLAENMGICFMGPSSKAPFDIDEGIALHLLDQDNNTHGRPNTDVVRPVVSAIDLVQQSRRKWTIDFALLDYDDARLYSAPFEYVREVVFPVRQERRDDYRGKWWQYARPRPEMRKALENKQRFIATPAVAKHRIFVWMSPEVLCNQGTLVFARDDDYFFGVLHSSLHELWARRVGTQLREAESGFRYTPTTTFETFPFPWSPGREPQNDARLRSIAEAARRLVTWRDAWLNPPSFLPGGSMQGRTLTTLYNKRPDDLDILHKHLDDAVFAAYGWPSDLSNDEILERLLALNLERAAQQ